MGARSDKRRCVLNVRAPLLLDVIGSIGRRQLTDSTCYEIGDCHSRLTMCDYAERKSQRERFAPNDKAGLVLGLLSELDSSPCLHVQMAFVSFYPATLDLLGYL